MTLDESFVVETELMTLGKSFVEETLSKTKDSPKVNDLFHENY